MKDEELMMKDDDFKLLRGFDYGQTDRQTDRITDICECRVAFATENMALACCYNEATATFLLGHFV